MISAAYQEKEEQLNCKCNHRCIDPKVLEISENVLKLIPPSAGYDYNRELFNRRKIGGLDRYLQQRSQQIFHCPFLVILIV
jgi:hypothetical protein